MRLVEGRRRSVMLSLTGAVWAVAWSIVAASAWVPGPAAAVCIIAGLALFGAGAVSYTHLDVYKRQIFTPTVEYGTS